MLPARNEATQRQALMLYNRLRKRRRHLAKWAKRTQTEAFRLYDRDIPEIPLVIDWYQDAVSGALYSRPYEKAAEEEEAWLDRMAEAIAQALEIPIGSIYLRERRRQNSRSQATGAGQYRKRESRGIYRDIREGPLIFKTNLSDYLDTGLFLDRRLLRARIRQEAQNKRVLNLFSYTCSFSVCAAAGGAREVDSVDISNTYLNWGGDNFSRNGFAAERISPWRLHPPAGTPRPGHSSAAEGALPPYRLIREDALLFLREARRARCAWDMIILDPPAFSNSKKMHGVFDLQRDHGRLLEQCIALLTDGGTLYFSAPARRFRLEDHALRDLNSRNTQPQVIIKDLTERLRDEDFRGKAIPRTYSFTRTGATL